MTMKSTIRPPSWALDSGGFSELTRHGQWTIPAREYVAKVAGYDQVIGGLGWAATQDWMCEPQVIHGGRIDGRTVPGTGALVRRQADRHQGRGAPGQ
jgi:hypothetical protein